MLSRVRAPLLALLTLAGCLAPSGPPAPEPSPDASGEAAAPTMEPMPTTLPTGYRCGQAVGCPGAQVCDAGLCGPASD